MLRQPGNELRSARLWSVFLLAEVFQPTNNSAVWSIHTDDVFHLSLHRPCWTNVIRSHCSGHFFHKYYQRLLLWNNAFCYPYHCYSNMIRGLIVAKNATDGQGWP
jgi:hypothetical protein